MSQTYRPGLYSATRRRHKNKTAIRACVAWLVATNVLTGLEASRAVYINAPQKLLVDEAFMKDLNVLQKSVLLVGGIFYGAAAVGNLHIKSAIGADEFCSDFALTNNAVRRIEQKLGQGAALPVALHQGGVGIFGAAIGGALTGLGMAAHEWRTGGGATNRHVCAPSRKSL